MGSTAADGSAKPRRPRNVGNQAADRDKLQRPRGKRRDGAEEGREAQTVGIRQRRLTRGDRNIAWIEAHCRVPEGRLVGRPVKMTRHQREWVKAIYDTPTRTFILSMARKNAKTALSAFLLLLHLCGPESKANSQLYSAAQSREQAAILFALAAKVVRMSPDLSSVVTIRDTAKQLYCPDLGTLYRALSAEASTAYGLSSGIVTHNMDYALRFIKELKVGTILQFERFGFVKLDSKNDNEITFYYAHK